MENLITAGDRQAAVQRATAAQPTGVTVICETRHVTDWQAALTAAEVESARVLDIPAAIAAPVESFTGQAVVFDKLDRTRDPRRGRLANSVSNSGALLLVMLTQTQTPTPGRNQRRPVTGTVATVTVNLATIAPGRARGDFVLAG